ncbi:MAG: LytTR family DNA-binding domain-containing protein [Pseudomonadota bacterium]
MRVLIVDDEHLARERLKRMLETATEHEIVGEASNGIEAIDRCADTLPDVVLLDIRMPGMDGLETARHLAAGDTPPAVVFCTAYEEHAVQAFDLLAVGYLLKPVRKEQLVRALSQLSRVNKAQLASLAEADGKRARSHIAARTHKGLELIALERVRFFQADQKYVTVGYDDGEVIVDETLRDLEEEFGSRLIRVHRNALVAAAHVRALNRSEAGALSVQLDGIEQPIDVSRRHAAGVRKAIQEL